MYDSTKYASLRHVLTLAKIIQNTFQPLIGPEQKLPKELVPRLLNRFWCDEGYTLFSDVQPFLQQIRDLHHAADHRVIVGVITNSDDRVPSILTSLGLRVGSLRFGSSDADHSTGSANDANDIDFSVMSYDVGHEKPDSRIFQAGEQMLREILEAQNLSAAADFDASTWSKVYIGDEYEKDVVGAVGAGWNAVLIDRENSRPSGGLEWMDCRQPGDLFDALHSSNALGFSSLAKLTEWLRPGP